MSRWRGTAINYYEHHIGDYAEATAHLSFVEDAAYSRLLRKYYATEQPLPADVKATQRLIGARSKDERAAVEAVLREFFELQEDGWHNGRADEELARYQEKRRKARGSARARWDAPQSHTKRNANAMRTHANEDANALPTQCEGNALQSPVPSPQTPDVLESPSRDTHAPTPIPRAPARVEDLPAEFFASVQGRYPAGTYRQADWLLAEREIRSRLEEGESAGALIAGVERYAAQAVARGSVGTQYVTAPSRFFRERQYREPFPLPLTKADQRLASNLDAAAEFMRRTEPAR